MEFHGFVKLDQNLVDTLGPYLEEREAEFGRAIVHAVDKNSHEEHPVPIPPAEGFKVKLFEAVEIFGKRLKELSFQQDLPADTWRRLGEEINQAGWHYLEFLEGSSVELFKHLKLVGLNQWKPELSQAVDRIKVMLAHHIEDLHWALQRLEAQLWRFRWDSEKRMGRSVWLQKLFSFGESILDKSLFAHIERTEKYLAFHYMKFANRYGEYRSLYGRISENNLGEFDVLNGMDASDKLKFQKLYDLLKLWEANRKAKAVPQAEVAGALNGLISSEGAKKLFKEYLHLLSDKLFAYSRNLKREDREELKTTGDYSQEARSLASSIANYREFLLHTDANPYVRARWGFSEWIVGPEPKRTKELQNLSQEVESVKRLFDFLAETESEPMVNFEKSKSEVQRLLHTMNQPLISKASIKASVQKVLDQIEKLNELATPNPMVVPFIAETLTKLLKADWKYNVLFEIPAFQAIYSLHCGIADHALDERQHINRLNKLKRMTQQILEWVKAGTTKKHQQELDLDLNDIKGCLQDFLAYIQRMGQDKGGSEQLKNWTVEMEQQLLEYRYLFGKFFHDLQQVEVNERLTRNQFLFVDRYLETIENLLAEIKQRPVNEVEKPAEDEED